MKVPYEAMVDKKKRPLSPASPPMISSAREALLSWHLLHGRHELPWRKKFDPYGVLISEFMLQQTTVTTVTPRYHAWMRRFPSIHALASASESEVLSAWEGLGYYSRARRLHLVANLIVKKHSGRLPNEESDLLALPGIGAYTAAAIRAFAHDQPAIVLDTNIIRVLARWGNILNPIDTPRGKVAIGMIAGSFFPTSQSRSFASALMDLGATVCVAGKPDCDACPLSTTCCAVDPEKLPKKSPRSVTTKLVEHRAFFQKGNRLFLEQSQGPRWPGLWILPELGKRDSKGRPLAEITYPITRYRVTMKIHRAVGNIPSGLKGFSHGELASLPMPSPFRKAIQKLNSNLS
jgi:A/G-specific adenine glycosylase